MPPIRPQSTHLPRVETPLVLLGVTRRFDDLTTEVVVASRRLETPLSARALAAVIVSLSLSLPLAFDSQARRKLGALRARKTDKPNLF